MSIQKNVGKTEVHHRVNSTQTTESVRRHSIVLHRQPTISTGRRPTRAPRDLTPRKQHKTHVTVDRRSHGSPDPADSPDVLEDSGSHRASSDTGRRASTARPLRPPLNQRLTNCWGRTTVGSTTSKYTTGRQRTNVADVSRSTSSSKLTSRQTSLDWPSSDHALGI